MPINERRAAGREISVKPIAVPASSMAQPMINPLLILSLTFWIGALKQELLAEKYFLPRLIRQFHSSLHSHLAISRDRSAGTDTIFYSRTFLHSRLAASLLPNRQRLFFFSLVGESHLAPTQPFSSGMKPCKSESNSL